MTMPGTITNAEMQGDMERYRVARDNNCWYILDKWHKDFIGVTADFEIPPEHPALITLNDSAFTALFKQAIIEGFDFDSYVSQFHSSELEEENQRLRKELEYNKNIMNKVVEEEPKESIAARVAMRKVDLVEKLIGMHGVAPDSLQMAQTITRIGGNDDAAG